MSKLNENPESTWGMTPAQKEAWVKKFAPKQEEKQEPAPDTSLSSDNPESTWGKTPEEKFEFFEKKVEGFDPSYPHGGPSQVGVNDPELFEERPATRNTLDAGPAEYSGDDRPIEYRPIYVTDGEQDFTPPPGDEQVSYPDNNQPSPPPVEDQPVTSEPNPEANDPEPEVVPPTENPEPNRAPEYTQDQPEYTDNTAPVVDNGSPGTSQPGATTEAPAEPVDMPTLDGQDNTANESSTTGGADVSQSTTPDATQEPTPMYEDSPDTPPATESNDSAQDTPGADAAQVREAASNRGRAKRSGSKGSFGNNDGTGVVEDISVEKR